MFKIIIVLLVCVGSVYGGNFYIGGGDKVHFDCPGVSECLYKTDNDVCLQSICWTSDPFKTGFVCSVTKDGNCVHYMEYIDTMTTFENNVRDIKKLPVMHEMDNWDGQRYARVPSVRFPGAVYDEYLYPFPFNCDREIQCALYNHQGTFCESFTCVPKVINWKQAEIIKFNCEGDFVCTQRNEKNHCIQSTCTTTNQTLSDTFACALRDGPECLHVVGYISSTSKKQKDNRVVEFKTFEKENLHGAILCLEYNKHFTECTNATKAIPFDVECTNYTTCEWYDHTGTFCLSYSCIMDVKLVCPPKETVENVPSSQEKVDSSPPPTNTQEETMMRYFNHIRENIKPPPKAQEGVMLRYFNHVWKKLFNFDETIIVHVERAVPVVVLYFSATIGIVVRLVLYALGRCNTTDVYLSFLHFLMALGCVKNFLFYGIIAVYFGIMDIGKYAAHALICAMVAIYIF